MNQTIDTAPLPNETLRAIEAKLGRPLRVLHIGNIANNAYNNARIQRQYGIEADVLSYDYYHVMSTPEWEDAEFEGEIDADFPNWWATSLKGWKRPDWFVQGPADACIQFLKAKHLGLNRLADLLWAYLEARGLGAVRHAARNAGKPVPALGLARMKTIAIVETLGIARVPTAEAGHADLPHDRDDKAAAVLGPAASRTAGSPLHDLLRPLVRLAFRLRAFTVALTANAVAAARQTGPALARFVRMNTYRLLALPFIGRYRAEAGQLRGRGPELDMLQRDRAFENRVRQIREMAECLLPKDRQELEFYSKSHPRKFFGILNKYDVIQCYAIDGFIPAMNGIDDYFAYEHGTLREMPFEQSYYGVLTRMAYQNAGHVFVTNSDVIRSVRRMALDRSRVTYLPHAFDDRKLVAYRGRNAQLVPPEGPAVFFSPTRQHWRDTSGSWTKGNDVLLRAAGILARDGHDFRLRFIAWGQDLEASKALIDQLGFADKVIWLEKMQKRELWNAYLTAHAVADQFTLPSLGGVGFEAMALGRRLITAIDEAELTEFFGSAPPCLSARDVETCAARMLRVIADPLDRAGLGESAATWMSEFHSAERIVGLQVAAYKARICPVGNQENTT